jgi:hypothetical protein
VERRPGKGRDKGKNKESEPEWNRAEPEWNQASLSNAIFEEGFNPEDSIFNPPSRHTQHAAQREMTASKLDFAAHIMEIDNMLAEFHR